MGWYDEQGLYHTSDVINSKHEVINWEPGEFTFLDFLFNPQKYLLEENDVDTNQIGPGFSLS